MEAKDVADLLSARTVLGDDDYTTTRLRSESERKIIPDDDALAAGGQQWLELHLTLAILCDAFLRNLKAALKVWTIALDNVAHSGLPNVIHAYQRRSRGEGRARRHRRSERQHHCGEEMHLLVADFEEFGFFPERTKRIIFRRF